MQMLFIAVAGILGLAIGYLMGFLGQRRTAGLWEGRLNEARQKLEGLKKDAIAQIESERGRATEAAQKAADATTQATELEKALQQHRDALKQTKAAFDVAEAARVKASGQIEAASNARQQAEGRCKQAEAMASQAQKSLSAAEAQLKAAQAEVETLRHAAERQAKEVQRLRADTASKKSSNLDEAMQAFEGADGSLDGILRALMEIEVQKAAVLADANGIIIAAVGDDKLREGMAATSHLVGSMATQLVDLVPFTSVRSFYLQDTQSNVLAGRAFLTGGEPIGLITYGPRLPSDRVLDGAMANLSAALE